MGKRRSKYDLELLRQTQAAEAEIDSIYREAVRRVTRLGYSREAPDGKLFSFDEAGAIVSQQFNAEQKRLMMSVASAIREDVRKSWKLANSKNDKMVQTVLNGRGLEITDRLKRRYFSTNDEALAAFIGRKNNGLGLSERVWKYAEQFKSEIEMAIDIGLRDGRSADALSRDVRAYLRNPDKLFRRVRDEHGQLVLSKAAKAYHPGRGVYRSSYKNARRLASTETNMAYHKADKERWAQLDFIVGFRVEPSKNHPEPDICDDLKGEYPKTFDFSGWHPHCRCHAVPIMKSDDEMMKDNAALLAGAEPSENSENTVKNVPAGFSEWVKLNGARIDAAKSLPYFIRDNKAVVDSILDPQPVRAAAVMRTPEDDAIKKAQFDREATLRYGNRMLRIMGGVSDETKALAEALKSGNLDEVMSEAKRLKVIGKQIMAVGYFKNPLALVREYSLKEIIPAAEHLKVRCTREEWRKLTRSQQSSRLYSAMMSYRGPAFERDLLWNEFQPKSNLSTRQPWYIKPNPAADMRHSKRTQEYFEDIHHKWALREMRVKEWGDFKASTKTAAQELKEYKGTAKELREMLGEAFRFYNEQSSASEQLSSDYIKEAISAQVKMLSAKNNTIRRPGAKVYTQDAIFELAQNKDLRKYTLPLWRSLHFEDKVPLRASLAREDIKRLPRAETELESIAKLAGGDETEGSCFSLAQAFAARRLGYDVVDYRGGLACHVHMSDRSFGYLSDLGRFRAESSEDVFNYIKNNMSIGEHYLLATHQHAAIVKKTVGDKIFYLEMQTEDRNGWHRLPGPATLVDRFGKFSEEYSQQMISFSELARHFDLLVGNLETIHNTGKQAKGINGVRK